MGGFGKSVVLLIMLAGAMFIHTGHAGAKAAKKEEKKMAESLAVQPFGLDPHSIKTVKIFIAVYTPKTSMGKEQIEIEGDGTIRLIQSANYRAPDVVRLGKVEPALVSSLLGFIESEGFMDLERSYTTKSPIKNTRQIKLTLPSGEKPVSAEDDAAPPQFNRILGAIRLLAGMGAPESLGGQYFFHL